MISAREMFDAAADADDNSFLSDLYCQLAQEYKAALCDFEFLIIYESELPLNGIACEEFCAQSFRLKGKHFVSFCGYDWSKHYWSEDDYYHDCLAGNFRIVSVSDAYPSFDSFNRKTIEERKYFRRRKLMAFFDVLDFERTGALWVSLQMPDYVLLTADKEHFLSAEDGVSVLVVDYDCSTCVDMDAFCAAPFWHDHILGGGYFYPIHAILKRPAGTNSFYNCTKAAEGFSFKDPRLSGIESEYIDLDRIPKKLKSSSRSKFLGSFLLN